MTIPPFKQSKIIFALLLAVLFFWFPGSISAEENQNQVMSPDPG